LFIENFQLGECFWRNLSPFLRKKDVIFAFLVLLFESKSMSKTTRRIKSPDALISLGYGGSATKSLYTRVDGRRETEFLGMEPYTAQVSQVSIENYQNSKLGCANPEDAAWVAVGDVYYAVGRLARTEFGADEALDELKYERAVEKTLAAIYACPGMPIPKCQSLLIQKAMATGYSMSWVCISMPKNNSISS
jgi:hypothetical protein